MKQYISQLENLLNEINDSIESRIEIEQIDLEEFDRIQKTILPPDGDPKNFMGEFRNTIVKYKDDKVLFEEDISRLEVLLTKAMKQLQTIKHNTLALDSTENNNPNKEIIELLNKGILSPDSIVSEEVNGKVVHGHLTQAGFLEVEVNGIKTSFGSLRKAVYEIWKIGLQRSQWEFWKVNNIPLEHFRKKLGTT